MRAHLEECLKREIERHEGVAGQLRETQQEASMRLSLAAARLRELQEQREMEQRAQEQVAHCTMLHYS